MTYTSKIFNYSRAVKDFDINTFLNGGYTCDCESSDYTYKPCKHVLTGNLDIISDWNLRNLFSKGPKYRESRTINFNADQRIIFDALEEYVVTWSKRENADPAVLDDWLCLIKSKIKTKIMYLKQRQMLTEFQVLKSKNSLDVLENLQSKYVIVPAD